MSETIEHRYACELLELQISRSPRRNNAVGMGPKQKTEHTACSRVRSAPHVFVAAVKARGFFNKRVCVHGRGRRSGAGRSWKQMPVDTSLPVDINTFKLEQYLALLKAQGGVVLKAVTCVHI